VLVPRTLIWSPWQQSRNLTGAERAWLGARIVCKPGHGSGSGGVVLDMQASSAALDQARDYDPDDYYLVQEFIAPLNLDGRPAWFRVYNCFGQIFPCFWDPATHATTLVTPDELVRYDLDELVQLSESIAAISGYTWFSSEMALLERAGRRLLMPIDYLNNKCFFLTRHEVGLPGMPELVAESVAWRLAAAAWHVAHRAPAP